MSDGYWMPQYKWQLVDQVFGLCAGRYTKKELERIPKPNLYGMRKNYIQDLKCGTTRKEVDDGRIA
jgi:hypothetical protein